MFSSGVDDSIRTRAANASAFVRLLADQDNQQDDGQYGHHRPKPHPSTHVHPSASAHPSTSAHSAAAMLRKRNARRERCRKRDYGSVSSQIRK